MKLEVRGAFKVKKGSRCVCVYVGWGRGGQRGGSRGECQNVDKNHPEMNLVFAEKVAPRKATTIIKLWHELNWLPRFKCT